MDRIFTGPKASKSTSGGACEAAHTVLGKLVEDLGTELTVQEPVVSESARATTGVLHPRDYWAHTTKRGNPVEGRPAGPVSNRYT